MNNKLRARTFYNIKVLEAQGEARQWAQSNNLIITGWELDLTYYDLKGNFKTGYVPQTLQKKGIEQRVAYTIFFFERQK